MSSALFVAGDFGDIEIDNPTAGKASDIAHQIFKGLDFYDVRYVNGGWKHSLHEIHRASSCGPYRHVFWFATNEHISKPNYASLTILVDNLDEKLSPQEVAQVLLRFKAHLAVELIPSTTGEPMGRVIDPLGNYFGTSADFSRVGQILQRRIEDISNITRIRSRSIDLRIEAPDESEFFECVREMAKIFHKLITPDEPIDRKNWPRS